MTSHTLNVRATNWKSRLCCRPLITTSDLSTPYVVRYLKSQHHCYRFPLKLTVTVYDCKSTRCHVLTTQAKIQRIYYGHQHLRTELQHWFRSPIPPIFCCSFSIPGRKSNVPFIRYSILPPFPRFCFPNQVLVFLFTTRMQFAWYQILTFLIEYSNYYGCYSETPR